MDTLTRPASLCEEGIAAQWAHFQRTRANLEGRGGAAPDEEWDALFDIEKFVLCGPIGSRADAIAKLEAVARSVAFGERYDGADVGAIAQVIRWLKANSPENRS